MRIGCRNSDGDAHNTEAAQKHNELPRWVVRSIQLLGLFFIVHFTLFLVQRHAASPEIKDGEYVLNNHGQIAKMLTRSEYLTLKGAELRIFATGWMFFYFVLTMRVGTAS